MSNSAIPPKTSTKGFDKSDSESITRRYSSMLQFASRKDEKYREVLFGRDIRGKSREAGSGPTYAKACASARASAARGRWVKSEKPSFA